MAEGAKRSISRAKVAGIVSVVPKWSTSFALIILNVPSILWEGFGKEYMRSAADAHGATCDEKDERKVNYGITQQISIFYRY